MRVCPHPGHHDFHNIELVCRMRERRGIPGKRSNWP